jgi:Recombinase
LYRQSQTIIIIVSTTLFAVPMRGKFTHEARAAARQAIVAQADTRARALSPVIAEIRAARVHSYNGIAAQLNARGIPTARGGRWAATQVRDIVLRSSKQIRSIHSD